MDGAEAAAGEEEESGVEDEVGESGEPAEEEGKASGEDSSSPESSLGGWSESVVGGERVVAGRGPEESRRIAVSRAAVSVRWVGGMVELGWGEGGVGGGGQDAVEVWCVRGGFPCGE